MSTRSENINSNPIRIGASKQLSIFIVGATGLALISVCLWGIYTWQGLFLYPVIIWLGQRNYRQYAVRTAPDAIVQCQWIKQDLWRLLRQDGQSLIVRQRPGLFRSPWMIMLDFEQIQSRRQLCLIMTSDAVAKQNYTALLSRTWLHSI